MLEVLLAFPGCIAWLALLYLIARLIVLVQERCERALRDREDR